MPMPIAAVITADIVHSTKMPPKEQRSTVSRFGRILSGHVFEFYRGDSLQAFIRNPNEALELVFQLRSAARGLSAIHDVRASIGIGHASARTTNTRTATSQPYVLSGRGFDQLTGEQRLRIQSGNDQANIAFNVIAQYADHIFRDLTIKQAEVVGKLLEQKTQTEVARSLKKAQATVNKHAQAASWDAIEGLIYEYKHAIKQFKLE
jgi:hypothetical protein